MRIETTKGALLSAFQAVDLGNGGTPAALCGLGKRGEVVSISEAGLLRYHSIAIEGGDRGLILRTETFGSSYTVAAEATIADAYVREDGQYLVDLEEFRNALKRLDKACGKSKRGDKTPVTISCQTGGPLIIEAAGVRIAVGPRQSGREGGPELYTPEGTPFTLRGEDVAALSALIAEVGTNDEDGYDSVAVIGGRAIVTDGYFLAASQLSQDLVEPLRDDLAIPRDVVEKLAKHTADFATGARVSAQEAYAATGALQISWRWHGEGICRDDRCLRDAESAAKLIDTALKSRPVAFKAEDILQAARELKAFRTKGQATLFLPHELGARLVRWDVKDGQNVSLLHEDEIWRAETVLQADWPIREKVAINLGFLEKVAKKAGETVELLMNDGLVAYRTPGDPIVRLSTEAKCSFTDREGI